MSQGTSSLVDMIDAEIEERSLLKHPFYQMWTRGELNLDHLNGYSREYFELVTTIPDLVENTLRLGSGNESLKEMSENLSEEKAHVELWVRFASSLGVSRDELLAHGESQKTIEAISELKELSEESFTEAVASLYAYERELPKISRSKLDGLKTFYGIDSKDARIYFETHEIDDVRHAAVWRRILEDVPAEKQGAALRAAVRSLKAQNKLLDSIMERYVVSS